MCKIYTIVSSSTTLDNQFLWRPTESYNWWFGPLFRVRRLARRRTAPSFFASDGGVQYHKVMMARFLTITVLVWLLPVALASQDPEPGKSEPKKPKSVGDYQGVVPGTTNPPAVKVPPGGQVRQATWPGFQMRSDGGSRIFVQLTSETRVDSEMQPDKFVVTLKNTAIAGPTNAYPLETRYFDTPVKRAQLKKKDQDTLLVLDLREEITPVISMREARNGYFFVFVDFPAANYPSAGSAGTTDADAAEEEQSPGPARSLPVGTSASAKGSASGRASVSAEFAISKKKMNELDEEKPPPVKLKAGGKAGGKFKFGSR